MDVSIVIVSFNSMSLLETCLTSIRSQTRQSSYEIIVVDNASSDGTGQMLRQKYPWVILIANGYNRGFAQANNQGFSKASGRYFFMLNPDTVILDRAIDRLVAFMEAHPGVGICGPKNVGREGQLQFNCDQFPSVWNSFCSYAGLHSLFQGSPRCSRSQMRFFDYASIRRVDRIMGCSLMIRADLFKRLGGLDDQYFMYFEETDFCYRARRLGYQVVFVPFAVIIHFGGESSQAVAHQPVFYKTVYSYFFRSQYRFYRKHYGFLPMLAIRALDFLFGLAVIVRNILRRNGLEKRKGLQQGQTIVRCSIRGGPVVPESLESAPGH